MDAKYILICSQKGGVGKTTIADELMWSLDRTDIPYSFMNLDPQPGVTHEPLEREDAYVVVIDTPGAIQTDMADMMKDADLIIIPCKASMRDMQPLENVRKLAETSAPDTPVIIVLNDWNRYTSNRQFSEWLKDTQRKNETFTSMIHSEQVVQAAMADESVITHIPGIKAAAAMLRAINVIRTQAGMDPEPPPQNRREQTYAIYEDYKNCFENEEGEEQ